MAKRIQKQNVRFSLCFAALISLLTTKVALAESCDAYPYLPLENIIEFDGGGKFKLLSTGSASVDFDETSEVMGARRQAELIAKRSIAEYINQNLASEDAIDSEIATSKTNRKATDGSVVSSAQRNEIKKQIAIIKTRADAVLKGAIPIGSCYTKGREIRVTIGIKSETVSNAISLGASMGVEKASSYGTSPKKAGESSEDAPTKTPKTQGYDGSRAINKF